MKNHQLGWWMFIPPNSLVVGVPGKVLRPVTPAQTASIAANAEEYRTLAQLHAGADKPQPDVL